MSDGHPNPITPLGNEGFSTDPARVNDEIHRYLRLLESLGLPQLPPPSLQAASAQPVESLPKIFGMRTPPSDSIRYGCE